MTQREMINAGLARVAKREGMTVEELENRWLQEKLDDDMRHRMLDAAGANKPDPTVIYDTKCAVTMYDMHIRLLSDGRERGLWIFLRDESPDRERNIGKVNEGALLEWPAAKAFHAALGKAIKGRR